MKKFRYSFTGFCVLISAQTAFSENSTYLTETLEEIQVSDNDYSNNNVSELGKIVKSAKTLEKQQVMGIRDLTRYDPGVYATEQGRGATSGYTIRGVDQNRVAIMVDGMPQIQSIGADFGLLGKNNANINSNRSESSGARNEIELENIATVEISKGGNSAQSGSGALGGAVSFTTKNVDDFLTEEEKFSGKIKSGYSSKDSQFMQSAALAFRHKGFEGMLQYTHRDGRETRSHNNAYKIETETTRQGWYLRKYDLQYQVIYGRGLFGLEPIGSQDPDPNSIYDQENNPFYLLDCEENCGPFYLAELTGVGTYNLDRDLTAEEQQQVEDMEHWTERLSAEDYTGIDRAVPDPKKFHSHSYLARLGYRPNDDHYLGLIFEDTKQKYHIRDMSVRAFYTPSEAQDEVAGTSINTFSSGIKGPYSLDPFESVFPPGQWTKTAFATEIHHKTRQGLSYIYNANSNWLSRLEINADLQNIKLNSLYRKLSCSPYPTVDENCYPSADKLGSRIDVSDYDMEERHRRLNLNYHKDFKLFNSEHLFTLSTGLDHFKSIHNREDYIYRFYTRNYEIQTIDGVKYYKILPATAQFSDLCDTSGFNRSSFCKDMIFKGKNRYLVVQNHIRLGEILDLAGSLRWDRDSIEGNQSFRDQTQYRNRSWSFNAILHPFKIMDISYRLSNGFRNPNVVEFFGPSVTNQHSSPLERLRSETSYNQEIGVTFKGDWGYFGGSYFNTKYRDLIGWSYIRDTSQNTGVGNYTYHNLSNMDLVGANIQSHINFNALWAKIPEGLSLNLAYGWSKAKKIERIADTLIGVVSLDAIQPPRFVAGLNYDSPNQTWGISTILTFSREKRLDETIYTDGLTKLTPVYNMESCLQYYSYRCEIIDTIASPVPTYNSTKDNSKSWATLDIIGYLNLPHNISIRAGIYNFFNRQYSNWESMRQSGVASLHRQMDLSGASDPTQAINLARYTAPGRNYVLNLEMKF